MVQEVEEVKRELLDLILKHLKENKQELNKIKIGGLLWFILGTLIMIASVYLYTIREDGFFYILLFIVSEPASWFFFWEGLSKIFITSKKTLPHYNFYKKMSKSEVHFIDY